MTNLLSNQAAAEFLNKQIPGEGEKYWIDRLNNRRRTDRPQPFDLKFTTFEGKQGFYREEDITAYIEFEKAARVGKVKLSSRAAQALHAFGGTAQGRQFAGAGVNLQVSNDTGKTFVQTVIREPLMVFAMTPAQAIEFGKELVEAGQRARSINGPGVSE